MSLCLEPTRQSLFQTSENSVPICFRPSLLPPVAHQQLRNDFNRDRGEGNESQPQSKHFTSLDTCFGLLVPWEKTHCGCTLAHKCPVYLVSSLQTTIAKCLCGHEEAWVGSFTNLQILTCLATNVENALRITYHNLTSSSIYVIIN